MSPPNRIYIVQGEISLVVTAMKRTTRWSSHSTVDEDGDPLLSAFSQLKELLNTAHDLDELEPNGFLTPFLEVIRSEDTTGPITGLALTSINKFLSYGLIDVQCELSPAAIENIADAVTHARFVGTDPSTDEVVLMKILYVLRTLLLCPAGVLLTNESVCEIMQSCFRICFEMRLSEFLRKSAEHTLMDMVQLLFTRLPVFKEDPKWSASMKKLKMRAGGVDPSRLGKRKRSPKPRSKKSHQSTPVQDKTDKLVEENTEQNSDGSQNPETNSFEYVTTDRIATTPVSSDLGVIDIQESFQAATDIQNRTPTSEQPTDTNQDVEAVPEDTEQAIDGVPDTLPVDQLNTTDHTLSHDDDDLKLASPPVVTLTAPDDPQLKKSSSETEISEVSENCDDNESVHSVDTASVNEGDFVNPRGIRFTQPHYQHKEGSGPLIPYGLPCVRELLRFVVSLSNPLDRHNTDVMIHMGLSLITVALEVGADHISSFNSLLYLIKDETCKNLLLILSMERLSLFAASLRVCFLLFESMRGHLKFQLEIFLTKLADIIVSETPKVSHETKEVALEWLIQLWRIPGLVTELYLNYDCDLYCSNLLDDITKLISKNAFPVSGLFTTHLLSLDVLLTMVDSIEQHCHSRIISSSKTQLDNPDKLEDKTEGKTRNEVSTSSSDGDSDINHTGPPSTGYGMAQNLLQKSDLTLDVNKAARDSRNGPQIKPNRMKINSRIKTSEEIAAIKHKKRLYHTGTEQFNIKPAKGIAFLQEQGLLRTPLDVQEVVMFLRENPRLDKKMIGEYIANRKNAAILLAYVKSFNFDDQRVDESLRQYLEAFRLPGEAPVISYLLEHFAEHWTVSNGEPFANVDAAFTLAYAVIMLNVDQHNHNVRRQTTPMSFAEFRKNLSKINGGKDFDEDMLEEIYNAIKNDEIVMPSEQTGLVKENYIWKQSLKRGATKDGVYIHAPTGLFDHEIFTLIWGPTVAALSFVFDKSGDEAMIQKAISGFRKCAMISAHYGISDVFDNLGISLCKFTTLMSSIEAPENIPVSFGSNFKAQLAARTVFALAHRHGDILREGWKNILDCMLQLYRAKLLPQTMIEVEDFADASGKICIIREDNTTNQRSEAGVFSSFYSYFSLSEASNQKGPTLEEQDAAKQAQQCIEACHIDLLILDSKFLREDSLQELVKALILACQGNEDEAVFFLELLIKTVLQNRDRVSLIWQAVRDHLYDIIVNAYEQSFLVERAVVGLLRLAIRLLRREEIAPQVLTSLRILLMMKPEVIHNISRQVAYGLHDLLRTNAANIHSSQDWFPLFMTLEVVGAGANPAPLMQVHSGVDVKESLCDAGAQSDSEIQCNNSQTSDISERGYTSDSELYDVQNKRVGSVSPELQLRPVPDNGSWLLVNKEDPPTSSKLRKINQFTIDLNEDLHYCDSKALLKSSETLSFLVRDAAHITPHNFESCVHAIRTFVEASLNGGHLKTQSRTTLKDKKSHHRTHRNKKESNKMKKSNSSPSVTNMNNSDDDSEHDNMAASLHSLSIQLLDLMHTLHTRAANIFSSWAKVESEGIDAETKSLWAKCWCPLLQGIAILCCDSRRQVRSQALTYLQRALLVHDLQTLSAVEWEACFNKVLFPLLTKLLENINSQDPGGMEETRMRASTLLCKVFLQHLSPLLSLTTFTALWLTILDFMEKYMHADRSDLLSEAIPESLKNMLLVMETAGIFKTDDGIESQLWKLTWDKIDTFLPNLKEELFKPEPKNKEIERNDISNDTSNSTGTTDVQPDIPLEGVTVIRDDRSQSPERASSPLMSQEAPGSNYILHPPLPVTPRTTQQTQPISVGSYTDQCGENQTSTNERKSASDTSISKSSSIIHTI